MFCATTLTITAALFPTAVLICAERQLQARSWVWFHTVIMDRT